MLNRLLLTFFYAGYSPVAPGTAGTLATLPVIWFCPNNTVYVLLLLFFFFAGRYAAGQFAASENKEDPQEIVIDEVVGMMLAMLFVPLTLTTLILGFILFRLFDITKPWVIKRVESLPNGYGIMMDDVLAGVFANIVLQVLLLVLPLSVSA